MGACLLCAAAASPAAVLDDLANPSAWQAAASEQVHAALRRTPEGLCLDYDFAGVSGFAALRRTLSIDWPARFDLVARLSGRGATNDLQLKFVDASGDNVWWLRRPDFVPPSVPTDLRWRGRHVEFAWGPSADRALRHTQSVELVVAAGRDGGRGSLCLARLALVPRAPEPAAWPPPREHRSAHGLDVDFGVAREFDGVALRWPAGARGLDYDLLASDDGRRWRLLRRVRASDGALDALYLPDSEARWLRVRVRRGAALPALELGVPGQWRDFNAVLASLAAALPRGELPRAFLGEQNYWTLVGVDGGGARSGLLGEDGAIEVGRGGASVAPAVVLDDGTRATWADVAIEHALREGDLPVPRVRWRHAAFTLDVEAAADGPPGSPDLLARYVLRNTGERTRRFALVLAVRPWQVNPPQQFLATPGGAVALPSFAWRGGVLALAGHAPLAPTVAPARVGALPFDGGLGLDALLAAPPLAGTLADPQGRASAALRFEATLAPGESARFGWVAPLGAHAAAATIGQDALDARVDAAAARWRERLHRVEWVVPPEAQRVVDSARMALAQILMSRDGPMLRPGTRAYARSWIRDGAMMAAGLVRMGEAEAARAFVDAYATRLYASGKVPCCVDARGADPVAENDSPGEFLHAVALVWRHTGDAAFLARHWGAVQRVTAWLEGLRQRERRDHGPGGANLFGLLPPSISHEGYADKPAYAYWDDFWALAGYDDAVAIARALGHADEAARWAAWRDEFAHDLAASVAASAARWGVDVVVGAADRGDFDPTSTTVALDPAAAPLPPALLDATFERYWSEASARAAGTRDWQEYTPYELRNVGALLRLGHPERARALLDFFFAGQRPAPWRQWAEVVRARPREPHFLGDMPHAWVASDYLRAALDLFAYERDGAIVVGAGVAPRWREHGDVALRGLSTASGPLSYALRRDEHGWTLHLERAGGPVRLAWPGDGPLPAASDDGRALAWQGRELALPPAPCAVRLERR